MKRDPKGAIKAPKRYWPAWRYSVDDESADKGRVFQKAEDVPEGYFPTLAESAAWKKAQSLPAVKAANAEAAAKGKKKAPQELSPEGKRQAKVDKLVAAGYDPNDPELVNASDNELDAALKALPDAAK